MQLERKLRILNEQNYSIVNRHKLELQHAADAQQAELAQHTAALQVGECLLEIVNVSDSWSCSS